MSDNSCYAAAANRGPGDVALISYRAPDLERECERSRPSLPSPRNNCQRIAIANLLQARANWRYACAGAVGWNENQTALVVCMREVRAARAEIKLAVARIEQSHQRLAP